MKKILLLLICAGISCFMFQSCEKNGGNDRPGSSAINWWHRYQLGPEGVKSIKESTDQGAILELFYDKDGKITKSIQKWSENPAVQTTYTYDSDNYLIKIVTENQGNKTVETMEYKNKGKFLPKGLRPFHMNMAGLTPDLSKYKFESTNFTATVVYEFEKNGNLLIKKTENGEETGQAVEYKGNYPYALKDTHSYVGPISYQDNGMFKIYEEGFLNNKGEKEVRRKYYYRTNFNNNMLLEKWESLSDIFTEKVEYEYDTNGNMTKETSKYKNKDEENYNVRTIIYSYVFDSKGNWTKQTRTQSNPNGINTITVTREIVYY